MIILFFIYIQTGQAIGNTRSQMEGNLRTQLIAHDKEVFDICFSKAHKEIFGSVGKNDCRFA